MLPLYSVDPIYRKDPFITVSIHDSAIKWDEDPEKAKAQKLEFVRTRDITKLEFHENQFPTKFYLKSLPAYGLLHLENKSTDFNPETKDHEINPVKCAATCFYACLTEIHNLPKEDGDRIGVLYPKNGELFTDSEIDKYLPSPYVIREIGWVAYRRHSLMQGIAKHFA